MSGLELNKIFAALLVAAIIAMISGIISEGLFESGHGHKEEATRGYVIPGAEESATASSNAPAEEEKPVEIAPLMAKADVKAGEGLVKRCTSCHTFDKGGKNGVGPNQWGLVGASAAHKDDFAYSEAFKALHGKKTWTFQDLSDFLANPKKVVPGNKMAFAGLKSPQDRANLMAYLNTLSDKPLPLPK